MKKVSVLAAVMAGILTLGLAACLYAEEAAPAAPAAPPATSAASPDDPVATVNGKAITLGFIDKVMEQMGQGQNAQPDTPEARRQVLEKVIELELVSQRVEGEGLDKTRDVQYELAMARMQLLHLAFIKHDIFDVVKLTPEEMKAYYDTRQDEFKSEEEVTASHILVETEDEAKAVKERLDKGEDFAAVAKEKSKCPSAQRGGDLGGFGKGRMVPEFEKAAFALKDGEVSGPVKTQFGWHIIKLTGRKEAGVRPLDDVKQQIEQKLLQEKHKKVYEEMLAEMKAAAKIDIKDASYAAPAKADEAAMGGEAAAAPAAQPAESE